jgi:hypothetical protein
VSTGAADSSEEPVLDRSHGATATKGHEEPKDDSSTQAFLEQVMAEIDQEVRTRRASGDLPARVERELDELFLEFSPVAGPRRGEVSEVLRMVDATAFVDPVVPLESAKSGGAAIKKTVRSLTLWYMNFVTMQVNQFSSAVTRCLHVMEDRLEALEEEVRRSRPGPAEVVEVPAVHQAAAPWVRQAISALASAPGRVLHTACGDGWLVRVLHQQGLDAYGVDPRPEKVAGGEREGLDLRAESAVDHLRAVSPEGLGGVVLTGLVEPMTVDELHRLVDLVADGLAPEGLLVLHCMSPSWWGSEDAPAMADLVAGHPLRQVTWRQLLVDHGFVVSGQEQTPATAASRRRPRGEGPADYLVVARRDESVPLPR